MVFFLLKILAQTYSGRTLRKYFYSKRNSKVSAVAKKLQTSTFLTNLGLKIVAAASSLVISKPFLYFCLFVFLPRWPYLRFLSLRVFLPNVLNEGERLELNFGLCRVNYGMKSERVGSGVELADGTAVRTATQGGGNLKLKLWRKPVLWSGSRVSKATGAGAGARAGAGAVRNISAARHCRKPRPLIYVFTQPLNSYYQASFTHFLELFGFHLVPIIYILCYSRW